MNVVDRLSSALAVLAGVMVILLIGVMIYEVVCRYAFNAPTLWAGDMTYMLGGALFVLSAAFALKENGHVSIDFLAQMLPERLRFFISGLLMACVALPAFTAISWVAANKAISAYERGTVDPVSAFAPKLWPFYSIISIGLVALSLQILVTAIRDFAKAAQRHA